MKKTNKRWKKREQSEDFWTHCYYLSLDGKLTLRAISKTLLKLADDREKKERKK